MLIPSSLLLCAGLEPWRKQDLAAMAIASALLAPGGQTWGTFPSLVDRLFSASLAQVEWLFLELMSVPVILDSSTKASVVLPEQGCRNLPLYLCNTVQFVSEKNHIIFILFSFVGFLSDSQAGLLALCVIGNFPNTCNKNSVSLIQLSAFTQSVLSLCLSNVRVDIFYLLKSINLLLWR